MLRSYLLEHVVTNTDAVDRYVQGWARAARTPEAKAWMEKRLRSYILNTEALLTPVQPHDVPPNAPGYVRQAIDRGETVYAFNSTSEDALAFKDRVQHIQDFFNSLAEYAQRRAANAIEVEDGTRAKKWLAKIGKMTIEQVEAAAEQWNQKAGARARTMTKEGCVILHMWDDGYYAVRYTDRGTMMRDGHDLQNCLRSGTYWDQVQAGRQWVVSIRKPNDEAVVGMRWTLSGGKPVDIVECKGKNNQPAGPTYVPYIVDLLPRFGITNVTPDLTNAGIFANKGRYGTFKDVSTHKKVDQVVEYWRTDSKFVVKVGRKEFGGNLSKGVISTLNITDIDVRTIIRGLTALNPQEANPDFRGMTRQVRTELFNHGVFQGRNGAFGSAQEVGEVIGRFPGRSAQVVVSKIASPDGDGYLVLEAPEKSILINVSNGLVTSIDEAAFKVMPPSTVFAAFNAALVKGNEVFDNTYSFRFGIAPTKEGYKQIENAGTPIGTVNGTEVWEIGKRLWLYEIDGGTYEAFRLRRGNVLDSISVYNGDTTMTSAVAKFLARKYNFDSIEGVSLPRSGMLKLPGRVVATPQAFIKEMGALGETAIWSPLSALKITSQDMAAYIKSGDFDRLSEAELKKLYAVMDPVAHKKLFRVIPNPTALSVFGKQVKKATIEIPTMVFWFQNIWADYEPLKIKVLAARDAIQQAVIRHVKANTDTIFKLDGQYGENSYYNSAENLIREAAQVVRDHRASIESELRSRANSVPDDADVSSRYEALNSLRKLNK